MHAELRWEIHLKFNKSNTYRVFIGAEQFGPAFLQDHDPDFVFLGGFREKRVIVITYWHKIVDHYLLVNPSKHYSRHVKPVWVDVQLPKQVFYSKVVLRKG